MKKLIIILLLPLNCQAQMLSEGQLKTCFDAWAKQTGFEREAGQAGDAIYKKIPDEVKKPLEIIAGIYDTMHRQYVSFNYKYEF